MMNLTVNQGRLPQINDNSTVEEIAEITAKVFSKEFDDKFQIKSCMATAEKIHKCIKNKT